MSAVSRVFRDVRVVFDAVRKIMHFIVLLLFFMVVLAAFSGDAPPRLPQKGALLLNLDGPLVEQLSGDPVDRAMAELQGAPASGNLVRHVVRAIDHAIDDDRVTAIVLRLESQAGGGLTKLQAVGAALERFRASGKKVYAYGDYYAQPHYYLAAHADEIYLHPSGGVLIDGYGRFRTYYREAIEKLQIDWNVFKVGEYKSFVEPYLRDDMSPEDRRSAEVWLGQLWRSYVADVTSARDVASGGVETYVDTMAARTDANGGDLATLAVTSGMVDKLMHRDEFRDYMADAVGRDDLTGKFNRIPLGDYIAINQLADPTARPGAQSVGVLVASGNILDGTQPSGTIGGDSTAALIRKATRDEDLKALVLLVDSGGGSKFASEVIQREVLAFKRSGRPVVAYMSSVAASGGYWISMDADEIWANASTITGSIGIGGYFPTFQRSMDRLGLHVDGVGTTRLSGQVRPDRPLGEDARMLIQRITEYGYQQFITGVASARDMAVDDVDSIARGRVWSGLDAQRIGLVDELGTLDDAIAAAAQRAGLGDDYGVRYVEKDVTFKEQIALMLAGKAHAVLGEEVFVSRGSQTLRSLSTALGLEHLQAEIEALARFNDPQGLYAYCFCRVD